MSVQDSAPPSLQETLQTLADRIRSRSSCDVSIDRGARALYATDSSNYRQLPLAVVVPRTSDDVVSALQVCHELEAPVLTRGGGTSLAGQACNTAVVLDCSQHLREIKELDPYTATARVECGCVLDDLQREAEPHGLFWSPDPSTHGYCVFGGMIGNNSCGVHSLIGGRTVDRIQSMTIATHSGEVFEVGPTSEEELERICAGGDERARIYRELRSLRDEHLQRFRTAYPDIPRRVSGYNLEWLLPENGFNVARALVGTEGTCACILDATIQLDPSPPARGMAVIGYPDIYAAGDAVPDVLERYHPIGLEGMDHTLVDFMLRKHMHKEDLSLLPHGDGWLIVEVGAQTQEEADEQARSICRDIDDDPGNLAARFISADDQHAIWEMRKSGLGATAHVKGEPEAWPGWEDSAVPPEKLGDYLRVLAELYHQYGFRAALYGHFGQGLVHTRIPFDLRTDPGIQQYREFLTVAAQRCVEMGGSLSGEHGDGQVRGELLRYMYDPEMMSAFQRFKRIWDPQNRMNPGKSVDARPLDENLRLGRDYAPQQVETGFAYSDDSGNFSEAMIRCVGVGKCRDVHEGTMCPSYQVTLDEKHSTRGRARLLFEMLNGELQDEGWRSETVKEALDLCLSCKGCKDECPVNVDMATYKAEFLHHHYRGRLRPRHAYSMGLIDIWARIAAKMPRLANFCTQTPGLRRIAAWAGGIDPRRQIPRFASTTFRSWFQETYGTAAGTAPRERTVLFWPDTFSNHLDPEPAKAAVRVLVASGHRVELTPDGLCCGRPLYDYGMLDRARHLLRRNIDALRDPIRQGYPLVGVEPSCLATFRDELHEMLPEDQDGKRLSTATHTFAEFIDGSGWQPPQMGGAAILHGHCHQKAVMGVGADQTVLEKAGMQVDSLDSGCCGLAGSFGFEKGHYDVSVGCAERVLLPRVRAAKEEIVVADGFSCRTQVDQLCGKRPQHLAQVLDRMCAEQEETAQGE